MKRSLVLFSVATLLFSVNLNAQGEAAIPFLTLNPDVQSVGFGWGGAANVSSGSMGYYYNPAILGYYSRDNNISIQTYTSVPDWLNMNWVKMYSNSVTFGYSYKNLMKDLNVSAGFGYIRYKVDYNYRTIETEGNILYSNTYDKYDAYSLGLSVDYYVNLSFGFTIKDVYSVLTEQGKVRTTAKDWGLLLNVPIVKLIDKDYKLKYDNLTLKPFADLSFGYSRSNIGNEIYYIDPVQKDPIPLTARLGYNLSIGSDINMFNTDLRLLEANFMIDAEDILIKRDMYGFSYQKGLGDINITENLIKWKSTDKNYIRKGRSLSLLETISMVGGSYIGPGNTTGISTNGYVVSTNGLFKILSSGLDGVNPYFKYILNHLEFRYVNSTAFAGHEFETKLSAATVSIKNITF